VIVLNTPNLITLSRIVMIPLIIGVYYLPEDWMSYESKNITATAIFIFGAVTDWLDGYLARKLNQMSAFGAFLDPVADKLVVVGALIVLLTLGRVDMVVGLIIIGREIAVSALREWMAELGHRTKVRVSALGKYKTIAQMVGVSMLLYRSDLFGLPMYFLGKWLTVAAAILTLWSMFIYLRAALPYLRERAQ